MDVHPTPFPGKRRPAAAGNPREKDRDIKKPSDRPAPRAATAVQTRPKRVFGTARSTNIPIDKPPSKATLAKTSKPWKPSGAPVAAAATQKASSNATIGGSGKIKAGVKKTSPKVSFQEPAAAATEAESINKSPLDDGVCTPLSSIKSVAVAGTPYLSAENCSKCKFDRLEGSSYWLGQIKVAESVSKHFVSAAFFRLALDCHAQPFLSLQSELKHYVARHGVISSETLWVDLCRAYGLLNDQTHGGPCDLDTIDAAVVEQEHAKADIKEEANCETTKDEYFEYDFVDMPALSDVSEKEIPQLVDINIDELKNDIGINESVDGSPRPKSLQDSPPNDGKKSLEGVVSGKLSHTKKSTTPSVKASLSNSSTRKSFGSSDEDGKALNPIQSSSKNSGGKAASMDAVRVRVRRNSQLISKGKEDEKSRCPDLSDNFNSDAIGDDQVTNQD